MQVFELLVQKNAMEHELQRSAAAAAAAVQQAVRGRHEAESAARHSKTRLDAAAAEIQALQAQVRASLGRACSVWMVCCVQWLSVCSSRTGRSVALPQKLQPRLFAPSSTSR